MIATIALIASIVLFVLAVILLIIAAICGYGGMKTFVHMLALIACMCENQFVPPSKEDLDKHVERAWKDIFGYKITKVR